MEGLFGGGNEVELLVYNYIPTHAAGSTVSTISKMFYNEHCSNNPIKPLGSILKIECGDGELLPYKGMVELDTRSDTDVSK